MTALLLGRPRTSRSDGRIDENSGNISPQQSSTPHRAAFLWLRAAAGRTSHDCLFPWSHVSVATRKPKAADAGKQRAGHGDLRAAHHGRVESDGLLVREGATRPGSSQASV